MKKKQDQSFYQRVYQLTKKIPKGRVASYGQLAVLLGNPRAARAVGYALSGLKKDSSQNVPWQRVINSKGEISFKGDTMRANIQRKLLEKEGIEFNSASQVDFKKFGWLANK